MSTDLRTELLKLRTTPGPWLLVAACCLITLGLALQPMLRAGRDGAPSIGTVGAALNVIGATGKGSAVALLLGVLAVTGEIRHQTIASTLLQRPHRARLIAVKALTAMLVGAGLAVLSFVIVLIVGLTSGALSASLVNADIVLRAAGLLLAYPLLGLLGVGVGALLARSQPVAVLLPLAWMLYLEDLVLGTLARELLPWSLSGVTAALANAGDLVGVLPVWVGAAALLGYGLLVAAAGAHRTVRRDIT